LALNTTKDAHISFFTKEKAILDVDIKGIESHLEAKPE